MGRERIIHVLVGRRSGEQPSSRRRLGAERRSRPPARLPAGGLRDAGARSAARINHVGRTLQDNFIGYPSEFVEPPVGLLYRARTSA